MSENGNGQQPEMRPWTLVWQQVNTEFRCDCTETVVTKVTCSNGAIQYRRQCTRCGACVGSTAIAHASLDDDVRKAALEFDREKERAWRQRKSERAADLLADRQSACAMQAETERQAFVEEYHDYLATPEWREKADAVLSRDRYLCQGCRKRRATQVHHLTYAHRGAEFLFELISLCDECHERLHQVGRYATVPAGEEEFGDDREA